MTDTPPPVHTLASMTAGNGDLRTAVAHLARNMAEVIADPRTRSADQRPVSMGRRMGRVTAVNPGPPLTADVLLDGVTIPGVSPQSTYRPQVADLVWLEFLGPDAHISPPLTTEVNREWATLALSSGWSTYSAWGRPLQYWRDPLGFVHLRGAVAGGVAETNIAVLPASWRPPGSYAGFAVYCNAGGGPVAAAVAIAADGGILYQGPTTPVRVALDGIHFRID